MAQHSALNHAALSGAVIVQDDGVTRGTASVINFTNGSATYSTGTATVDLATGVLTTFTPTWTASSSNPTIGDGTITGLYQRVADKLYWVCITITIGSTTSAGTGSYTIGNLPVTTKAAAPPTYQMLTFYYRDAGTTNYMGMLRLPVNATASDTIFVTETAGAKAWSASSPVAPANGDVITIMGTITTTA